ncbi:MAG TPA: hypothetical protein VGQ83_09720 [Polyangia bacterium]|jgi:nitrate/TMAO reductase-like tetraheme cytochrome c subunit
MKKWLIAGITMVTFAMGGAALATKDMGADVGVKSCKTCHEGSPKDKKLTPKMAGHLKDCKAKQPSETCKSCHAGASKGTKKCK